MIRRSSVLEKHTLDARPETIEWKPKLLPGKHKFCDGRTFGAIAKDGHLGMHPPEQQ